jgi:hypothetical protein
MGIDRTDDDSRGPTVHRMMLGSLLHRLRTEAGVGTGHKKETKRA